MNHTKVSYFILSAYFDTGHLKYLYFVVVLLLYIFILSANLLLIVVVCVNRSLHEPMYMFLCSLFVNELYGSTGLFPFLLFQILSDVHTVSAALFFLQMFSVYSYALAELTNLAVMSYDRYVSICYPLQYYTRMTSKKVTLLIVVTWFPPFVAICIIVVSGASLQLCGNIVDKLYSSYAIIKLACYDTTVNNVYGVIIVSLSFCAPTSVILYSYLRILQVCFSGCKRSRRKALRTCTPQLVSFINYAVGGIVELRQVRFSKSTAPSVLGAFLSLYFLMCQPLLNPVMYGLKLSKVRRACKSQLLCSVHQ